jgi:hypothetical protein
MKISIPGFIYAVGVRHFDMKKMAYVDTPDFRFNTTDNLTGEHFRDYALVGPHEIIAEVPDSFDPRKQFVDNLEAEKKRIRAEFNKRITELDRQIQTYLAIEAPVREVAS